MSRLRTKGTCFLDVSAEEAQNLLMEQGKDGNFVIRPSESKTGNISLSVRHRGSVLHIKIQNTGELFDLFGGEQFSSLVDLVEFYKDGERLKLENGDFVRFSQPFFLNTTGDRCERWFHGGLTSQEANERLRVQSEGSFLVRESQSTKGTFVLSVRTGQDKDITEVIINKNNGKYDIDGRSFKDLTKLIDHYRKHEITAFLKDKKKINFTLKKAVNLGAIVASDIPARTGELMKQFPGHDKERDGFWEEFEQVSKLEMSTEIYNLTRIVGKKEDNTKKNRFKNILPYDETRVILNDKIDGDYINANYIRSSQLQLDGISDCYIATQGCLKNTASDFWRMVWLEKSSIIVMTTRVVEMGKVKCFQYWPEEEGQALTFEFTNGTFTVDTESKTGDKDFFISTLKVTREIKKKDKTDSETRTVFHFHFPEWPDKKAPKDDDIGAILEFIQAVNDKKRQLKDSRPMIVHCSAGIGRTGTFLLIDVILNKIRLSGLKCPIDIPNTLLLMRQMRSGLVQTEAQYRFAYLAIRQYIESMQQGGNNNNNRGNNDIYCNDNSNDRMPQEGVYANQQGPVSTFAPKSTKPKPLSPKPTNCTYENLGGLTNNGQ